MEECMAKFVNRNGYVEKKCGVIKTIIKTVGCFAIVQFAWIFFRAGSIHKARAIIKQLSAGMNFGVFRTQSMKMISGFMPDYMWMQIAWIVIVAVSILWIGYLDFYKKYRNKDYLDIVAGWGSLRRWIMYYVAMVLIMFCFVMTTNEYGQAGAFLYFQF